MLSRVAESMFWMSRYIERAENTACFLDVNYHLSLDLHQVSGGESLDYWESLIQVTGEQDRFQKLYEGYDSNSVTDFLLFNPTNPSSISSCIALARENARSSVEALSSEIWEGINNLYHFVLQADPAEVRGDPFSFCRAVKIGSQLFQGGADATLLRNEGWDFVQLGKYLERADNIARLVDVKYDLLSPSDGASNEAQDVILWMSVLKSCSALEAFRKVHLSRLDPEGILGFLVLERSFPRSILYSIAAAEKALWHVSGSSHGRFSSNADRLIGKLESELSYVSVDDLVGELRPFLVELEQQLKQIGEQIHQTYFAYQGADVEIAEGGIPLRFLGLVSGRPNWRHAEQQQQQEGPR